MQIKKNIRIKQIGDEKILVSNDGKNLDYTRIISLNQSAAFLIDLNSARKFDNGRMSVSQRQGHGQTC